MLASLIIVFREVFEAGLIIGIVLAATRGMPHRGWWISGGIAVGILGSVIVAAFAGKIADLFAGSGQEVFAATVLIIAALMLGWHNIWMAHHGRAIAKEMSMLGSAVAEGDKSFLAMATVVAIAVLREGSEVVLFLYGIVASGSDDPMMLVLGGVIGIALGGLISYLLYRGLVAIPLKRLFAVTSWLIALLAAGMAGQAAATLASADIIPSWGYELWDTSWLLPDKSFLGRGLHVLVGYSDRPMGIQLAAYLVVLGGLLTSDYVIRSRSAKPKPAYTQGSLS
jgi:high-affinity iron transporter